MGQPAQGPVDLLLRVVPDGAGVQQDQVRLGGVVCKAKAHGGQHPPQLLAVGLVLLAAIGHHMGQAPLAEG